jgi:hypothetical protein
VFQPSRAAVSHPLFVSIAVTLGFPVVREAHGPRGEEPLPARRAGICVAKCGEVIHIVGQNWLAAARRFPARNIRIQPSEQFVTLCPIALELFCGFPCRCVSAPA